MASETRTTAQPVTACAKHRLVFRLFAGEAKRGDTESCDYRDDCGVACGGVARVVLSAYTQTDVVHVEGDLPDHVEGVCPHTASEMAAGEFLVQLEDLGFPPDV